MLSEQERQELKALAASSKMREQFERLSTSSFIPRSEQVNLDQLMQFLTGTSRMFPQPAGPSAPILSRRFLL